MENGFILLHKEGGVSSHGALRPLKRLLPKNTKIGHTGTLDPNAEGLLPVAIGRASKFIQYIGNHKKKYRAGILFGKTTDTGDIWGTVLETAEGSEILSEVEKAEKKARFLNCLPSFIGKLKQVPPMYSALKKDGKPLYKYAREGLEIERQAREIEIYRIDLLRFEYPEAKIEVECSKGTYIRTLIEDLAKESGEIACMNSLIRLHSDGFHLEDAHPISSFLTREDIERRLIPIEFAFRKLPSLEIDAPHVKHIKNGVPVDLRRFVDKDEESYGLFSLLAPGGKMFALAERKEDSFRALIVI